MSKNKSLFYGGVQWNNGTLFRNGDNGFIRLIVDCDSSSNVLTNVVDNPSYNYGINDIIVGQQLVISPQFSSGTTITAVDTSNNTITVSDLPSSTATGRTARVSPPKGQYFIESGSVTRPGGQGTTQFKATTDLTGSEDTNFSPSYSKFAVVAIQATTTAPTTNHNGKFAIYELTRIHSIANTSEFSGYISSSNNELLGEEEDYFLSDATDAGLLCQLSVSSSLPMTADVGTISGVSLGGGIGFAGYQTALSEYYDDLRVGIYHSGSLIEGNADFINFTGSAVKSITTASINGQNGVLIELEGGGGDTFPYTGSALITGSLGITGSFEMHSGSTKPFKVNEDGTVQLFSHENSYNPTAVLGGIYFTSQSVYFGLEE